MNVYYRDMFYLYVNIITKSVYCQVHFFVYIKKNILFDNIVIICYHLLIYKEVQYYAKQSQANTYWHKDSL